MPNRNNHTLEVITKGFTTVKGISIVLGIIISLGGATAVIDQYAPWAWSGEFKEVADMSCTSAINQRWDMILTVEKFIATTKDRNQIADLRRQKQRLMNELENLKRRCDKYYQ